MIAFSVVYKLKATWKGKDGPLTWNSAQVEAQHSRLL